MKKIFLSALFSSLIAFNASSMTLRIHTPVSVSGSDCVFNNVTYTCEPKSAGYSLRAIFGMLGIGYTSSDLDYGMPASSGVTKRTNRTDAVDLSGSFIDGFITVGVGSVIGGYAEISQTFVSGGNQVVMDITGGKQSGTTSFLNLAIDVGPVELIVGYRMWDTKIESLDAITKIPAISYSQSSTMTEKIDNKYNELTAGVGIKF